MAKVDTARLFRDCREALELTQAQLADSLWVGHRSIQHWEMGDRTVPGPVWVALAFLLKDAHRPDLAPEIWGIRGGKSQKSSQK